MLIPDRRAREMRYLFPVAHEVMAEGELGGTVVALFEVICVVFIKSLLAAIFHSFRNSTCYLYVDRTPTMC